jgi:cytochrome c oxidase subunit 2
MQAQVWQWTVFLVGVVAVGFLFVRGYSARPETYSPVQQRVYRFRAQLFFVLLVVGIPGMGYTLTRLPYVHDDAKAVPQIVTVTGYQWYWELDREEVNAGQPVEFRVTGGDVNHGLGIYDPEMRLLAQTQAMPGYVNRLRYTFKTPGVYRIACLEYCGLVHHQMITELNVVAP